MKAMAVSTSGALDAKAAQARGLPVVLAQGGIHAGEIDGKDAGFWLVRDLLQGKVGAGVLDKTVLQEHYAAESEKVFKPIRAFFNKQKIRAEFVAKVGPAADTIAALAAKGQFDLLMMGSHGHGLLGNLVLGSVTTKVMAKCEVPVLIVR